MLRQRVSVMLAVYAAAVTFLSCPACTVPVFSGSGHKGIEAAAHLPAGRRMLVEGAVVPEGGAVYETPVYSHMVERPEHVFPAPATGAFVYFVGVSSAAKRTYLHWALASIQSLQSTGTKYEFVVIFEGEDDIAMDAFRAIGVQQVHRYEEYLARLPVEVSAFEALNKESEAAYYHAWNKLLAWTFTEYEKVVVIDSDIIAWANVDELFLYPQLAAVPDSVWPLMSDQYTQYFNTGLMVIRPSLDTFKAMVEGVKGFRRPDAFWWDASEQTFLNFFFNTTWYQLPITFNYFGFIIDGAFRVNWRTTGLRLVHHLRESQFAIPADAPDCDRTPWVSCNLCCHRLVEQRDIAFRRLQEAGLPPERLAPEHVRKHD